MTGLARPIRTLIVDDEQMARASIRVLLGSDPEIELVGECASGVDAARISAVRAARRGTRTMVRPRLQATTTSPRSRTSQRAASS